MTSRLPNLGAFFKSPQLLDLLEGSNIVDCYFLFESFVSYAFWTTILFCQHSMSSHVPTTLLGAGNMMMEDTVPTLGKGDRQINRWWYSRVGSVHPSLKNSSILAWEIPWTEEPGGLQWGRKRVGRNLVTKQQTASYNPTNGLSYEVLRWVTVAVVQKVSELTFETFSTNVLNLKKCHVHWHI